MPYLAQLVTKSNQPMAMADSSLSVPALSRMAAAALQKEPVLKHDVQSNQELLVQELMMKQLLQGHTQASPKVASAQKPPASDFTSAQEALLYLLTGSMPPTFHQAPAPQPSADCNTLLLQNALAEIMHQQGSNKAASQMGNNRVLPVAHHSNANQGMQELLMDQRALEALLGQPRISGTNSGTNPYWGQPNEQDQSILFANLLGLQSTAPAPAFFSPQQQDPSLAALNLQLQAMQPSLSKTPDLQSALLSMLLRYQG